MATFSPICASFTVSITPCMASIENLYPSTRSFAVLTIPISPTSPAVNSIVPLISPGCSDASLERFPANLAAASPASANVGSNTPPIDISIDSIALWSLVMAPFALFCMVRAIFSAAPSESCMAFTRFSNVPGAEFSTDSHPEAASCPKIALAVASCSSPLSPFIFSRSSVRI